MASPRSVKRMSTAPAVRLRPAAAQADEQTRDGGDADREQRRQQRQAAAEEDARQQVAALGVGAQRMAGGTGIERLAELAEALDRLEGGVHRPDDRSEDDDDGQQDEQADADAQAPGSRLRRARRGERGPDHAAASVGASWAGRCARPAG